MMMMISVILVELHIVLISQQTCRLDLVTGQVAKHSIVSINPHIHVTVCVCVFA